MEFTMEGIKPRTFKYETDEGVYTVRAVTRVGMPWFVAKDVCRVLGYKNLQKAINDHCAKPVVLTIETRGGAQPLTVISGKDVSRILIRTNKVERGKKFVRWFEATMIPTLKADAIAERKQCEGDVAQSFSFNDNDVRALTIAGEPWFVAKDVCGILNHTNHRKAVKDICDEKGVTKRYPLKTAKGKQGVTLVNEGNLYRLIIRSRLPSAKAFESWVVDTVLPSIRKTGTYGIDKNNMADDVILARAHLIAKDKIKKLEATIEKAQPKVAFYDAFANAGKALTFAEAAKVLNVKGVGQNRLFELCRENGLLIGDGTEPYQRYIDRGYFRVILKSQAHHQGAAGALGRGFDLRSLGDHPGPRGALIIGGLIPDIWDGAATGQGEIPLANQMASIHCDIADIVFLIGSLDHIPRGIDRHGIRDRSEGGGVCGEYPPGGR